MLITIGKHFLAAEGRVPSTISTKRFGMCILPCVRNINSFEEGLPSVGGMYVHVCVSCKGKPLLFAGRCLIGWLR